MMSKGEGRVIQAAGKEVKRKGIQRLRRIGYEWCTVGKRRVREGAKCMGSWV